jgi:hypothetical protein
MDTIEITNDNKKPIFVSACRTKQGNLYVHIGHHHGNEIKVPGLSYAIIKVNVSEY